MPHYKDGTLAQRGDIVRGKPLCAPHEVIGQVITVTPGAETCNVTVAFIGLFNTPLVRLAFPTGDGGYAVVSAATDIGHARDFELVARAQSGEPIAAAVAGRVLEVEPISEHEPVDRN